MRLCALRSLVPGIFADAHPETGSPAADSVRLEGQVVLGESEVSPPAQSCRRSFALCLERAFGKDVSRGNAEVGRVREEIFPDGSLGQVEVDPGNPDLFAQSDEIVDLHLLTLDFCETLDTRAVIPFVFKMSFDVLG